MANAKDPTAAASTKKIAPRSSLSGDAQAPTTLKTHIENPTIAVTGNRISMVICRLREIVGLRGGDAANILAQLVQWLSWLND